MIMESAQVQVFFEIRKSSYIVDDCTLGLDSCTGDAMCVYDQVNWK